MPRRGFVSVTITEKTWKYIQKLYKKYKYEGESVANFFARSIKARIKYMNVKPRFVINDDMITDTWRDRTYRLWVLRSRIYCSCCYAPEQCIHAGYAIGDPKTYDIEGWVP